jgi:hypothetical protein
MEGNGRVPVKGLKCLVLVHITDGENHKSGWLATVSPVPEMLFSPLISPFVSLSSSHNL